MLQPPDATALRRTRPAPRGKWDTPGRFLAAVVIVVVACVACGSDLTQVSTTNTDPPLLVHDVRWRSYDAEINGTLRYLDKSGCFVLEAPSRVEPERLLVVVWPPGTTPWHEGGALVGVMIPWSGIVRLGDRIDGAGGYENLRTSKLDLPDVPEECLAGDGSFAMLHTLS